MARTEARIGVDIWEDPTFLALPTGPQRMYLYLLSQRDLTYVGVLALRERRWSRGAANYTQAQVRADLDALEAAHFVIVDHDAEELLVRSFVRGDRVYRQPNVLASAIDGLPAIASPGIRAELVTELRRVAELDDLTANAGDVVARMLTILDTQGSDPRTPNPSPKGSDNPSDVTTANQHVGNGYVEGVGDSPSPRGSEDPKNITPDDGSADDRPDVEQVCRHLADRIQANGAKRPEITRKWRQAARLMLDRDKRTVEQVLRAIDWAQDHDFWRANVLSMPKLREKYDQLRLQAQRGRPRASPGTDLVEHHGAMLRPATVARLQDHARFVAMDEAETETQHAIGGTP